IIRCTVPNPICGRIPVPRRKIDPETHSIFFAGVGYLFYDVPVTVLIRSVFYCVLRVFAWRKTKTVVVFCSKDNLFETCSLDYSHPLPGVQLRGIELRKILLPVAPFLVGERVDPEMKERRQLQFLPAQLSRRWNDMRRLPDDVGFPVCRENGHIGLCVKPHAQEETRESKNDLFHYLSWVLTISAHRRWLIRQ